MSGLVDRARSTLRQLLRDADNGLAVTSRGSRSMSELIDFADEDARSPGQAAGSRVAGKLANLGAVALVAGAGLLVGHPARTDHLILERAHASMKRVPQTPDAMGGLTDADLSSADQDTMRRLGQDSPMAVLGDAVRTQGVRMFLLLPDERTPVEDSSATRGEAFGAAACVVVLGGRWGSAENAILRNPDGRMMFDLAVMAHEAAHCVQTPGQVDSAAALPAGARHVGEAYDVYLREVAADRFALAFTSYWADSRASEASAALGREFFVTFRQAHDGGASPTHMLGDDARRSAAYDVTELVNHRRELVDERATEDVLREYDLQAAAQLLAATSPAAIAAETRSIVDWYYEAKARAVDPLTELVSRIVEPVWETLDVRGAPNASIERYRAIGAAADRAKEKLGVLGAAIADERAQRVSRYWMDRRDDARGIKSSEPPMDFEP